MDPDSLARDGLAGANGRRRRIALPEWFITALAVTVGYYLAARLGLALTLHPHPISTLWPPNALLAAVLMLMPTRAWWWILAAALPGHLAAELLSGVPIAMVLGWYVSNCSEALIAAGLVRTLQPAPLRLDSLRNVGVYLLCAVFAAPLLSSFIDAGLVQLVGWGTSGYWELVLARVPSNMLAELTVGPLVLGWAALGLAGLRRASPARHVEASVLFAGLLVVCFLVFDLPSSRAPVSPVLFYLPVPFLLWAAVRLGPAGAASALSLMTFSAVWGTAHGLGPFTGRAPQDTALDLQMFLIAVSVPILLLSVAVEERLRAEREASEQRVQLKHLSRVAMLGELSGGIAHELNQPLTAILANAQAAQHYLANKTGSPEMLSEILHDIVVADQRAGEVIQRLRALFKRGETQFGQLDVNRLVGEALDLARGDLLTRGVDVERELDAALPPVSGDRVELQQVMLNLLVNACEAMLGANSETLRLTVRTRLADERIVIEIDDTGPGFTAEQVQRMFEPFYTTKPQGLGLGLSISRAILRAHGGELRGQALPGGGARFLVELPVLRPTGRG